MWSIRFSDVFVFGVHLRRLVLRFGFRCSVVFHSVWTGPGSSLNKRENIITNGISVSLEMDNCRNENIDDTLHHRIIISLLVSNIYQSPLQEGQGSGSQSPGDLWLIIIIKYEVLFKWTNVWTCSVLTRTSTQKLSVLAERERERARWKKKKKKKSLHAFACDACALRNPTGSR